MRPVYRLRPVRHLKPFQPGNDYIVLLLRQADTGLGTPVLKLDFASMVPFSGDK